MADAGDQLFNSILLGTRSGTADGRLRIGSSGVFWKKSQGGKTVEVSPKEISGFVWSKTTKGGQLAVKRKSSHVVLFHGFSDSMVEEVKNAVAPFGVPFEVQEMACNGRNWGSAEIDSSTLVFKVGNKPAFRIPLRDVGQVQQGKDEIALDFSIDDTTGGDKEDALVGMSFHVPRETTGFPAIDEETPSTTVIYNELLQYTDSGAAVGDPVAVFESSALLAPRGRFDVELYLSFMKLTGQAQDYRIQYDSIVRIFVLPKSHTPHTLVVISLDPPIRKGQTFYPHILVQLPTEEDMTVDLEITEEQFTEKNEKCGGKLSKHMEGSEPEVFARLLRSLACTKLTKPGNFRTADGSAYALRCNFKADDGYLYPLERAFFYVHKPPTLIVFDEIESVEFLRQGGGLIAASAKTFDLNVRQRNIQQEFLFRGIQKQEWTNLFSFIQAKRIRIENLEEAQQGPGGNANLDFSGFDLGEDIDTGLAQQRAKGEVEDDEEEDEDFKEEADEEVEDAADESEAEEEEEEEKPKKKRAAPKPKAEKPAKVSKKAKADKPAKAEKPAKKTKEEKPDKKKKVKKDPNAPKRGLSAFMYFSSAERPKVKEDKPEISFGDVGKELGERWKAISDKEKAKFEEMAKKDKDRYTKEKTAYDAKGGAPAAADDDDDEDDE